MTTLVERLRGYNPPDRTVDSQRQISVDIHEAADTIEAQAAEIAARGNAVLVPSDKLKELQAKLEAQAALLMQCRDTLVEVMYSNCTDVAREKYMATIAALNEFEKGTE